MFAVRSCRWYQVTTNAIPGVAMHTLTASLAAAVLAVAPLAAGQDTPATDPLPADQMLDRMLQPGQDQQALQPSEQSGQIDRTSGSAAVAPNAPQVTVLRE